MQKSNILESKRPRIKNGQKKAIKLRKEVNRMYFEDSIPKIRIARKKHMSNNFVIKWTQSKEQDFTKDDRGWTKGKRRKWNDETINIIKEIHNKLSSNPNEFFTGATAIEQEWRKRYPDIEIPPLRTIGMILSDLGLSGKRKKGRNKGASRYLCYPEHTIYKLLGGRVLESDFIQKHITNRAEPLHFIGFSFKTGAKLRHYKRIEAQTSEELRNACGCFFNKFERPDYIKVDNGAAMAGSAYQKNKRNISEFMFYMLKNKVIPIFAVPRKPFSQASIEGNNSVFSRKFWNIKHYKNIEQIDEELEWFNDASMRYSGYLLPEKREERKDFIPKVYFIRQVREKKEKKIGYINILNEDIELPQSYINYFVLAEWNLNEEKLYIRYEQNEKSKIIKEIEFKINENSRKKFKKRGVDFHLANNH